LKIGESENEVGSFFPDDGAEDLALAAGFNLGGEEGVRRPVAHGPGNAPAVSAAVDTMIDAIRDGCRCGRTRSQRFRLAAAYFTAALFNVPTIRFRHRSVFQERSMIL
jgi:hypothetical protein